MTLAEAIKQVREDKGLTQKQVASIMGISQQAYGQYESGKREPKPKTIIKIANALNISPNYLQPTDADSFMYTDTEITDRQSNSVYDSYTEDTIEKIKPLLAALNREGQDVALNRVEELTQIPKYKLTDNQENDAE